MFYQFSSLQCLYLSPLPTPAPVPLPAPAAMSLIKARNMIISFFTLNVKRAPVSKTCLFSFYLRFFRVW